MLSLRAQAPRLINRAGENWCRRAGREMQGE